MTTLLDLCELIVDCEHKTAPISEDGYPSIRTPNVGRGRLILDGVNQVDSETYQQWTRRAVPRHRDLIIAREAPVGNVAIIGEGQQVCLGQRTVLVRPNLEKVDPEFLCYYMLGDYVQGQFHSAATGATVPHLNMRDIRGLSIPTLPSLPTQRRIATILSTYDDLIENNTRRIAILEEMARRLYEEWFVKFRFPGHEEVSFKETELGQVPDGWEIKLVDEIVKRLKAGKTYKQEDVSSAGGVVVVDQSRAEYLGFHNDVPGHEASSKHPIIIFGDHTCKMQIMVAPFSLGPNTVPFVSSDNLSLYYVYSLVQGAVETREYKRHWTDLKNKLVLKAPKPVADAYGDIVESMFRQMEILRRLNRSVRTQRDLLLPKLVSGEIDVSEVELSDTEEQAA